jgi:1-deoxy-D-xylulose-5-phosphate reductoisomerase
VLNAANEVSVAAFLDGRIAFPAIAQTNRAVLDLHLAERRGAVVSDLGQVEAADGWARERARLELGLGSREASRAGAVA